MTAIADFCETIRQWLNLGSEVYPDEIVTSWVRMAETDMSSRLRCDDMVQIDIGTLVNQRYPVPDDWREMDFVRHIGGKPLRYATRDDFYNPDEPYLSDQKNCYTMIGRYLMTGIASSAAPQVEISYYQDIPPLGDDPTWFSTKYPMLAVLSTLVVACKYAIEDERSDGWEQDVAEMVDRINTEHMRSKASGSRLTTRHRRSFG